MKNIFTPSEIEIIMLQCDDIISTSFIPEEPDIEDEDLPSVTIGPGGDIGLPFDPFSLN